MATPKVREGQSRIFRIFISSSFEDMQAERDALQRDVFPRLRRFCQARGGRFQAIDLRWGVSQELVEQNQTMAVCLQEVERCKRVSPRPNFVTLLGNRYGWVPIPSVVAVDQWTTLIEHSSRADRILLERWYEPDQNGLPPQFVLRSQRSNGVAPNEWKLEEDRLRAVFLALAARSVSRHAGEKELRSATEEEILIGTANHTKLAGRALFYFREIQGLPTIGKAGVFVDYDTDGCRDNSAALRLQDLKESIRSRFPDDVTVLETAWTGDGISNSHISSLCDNLYNSLSNIIQSEIDEWDHSTELDDEIRSHYSFGHKHEHRFVDSGDRLALFNRAVELPGRQSYLVTGARGSGRTTVIAILAKRIRAHHPTASVIVRHVGITPEAKSSRRLVWSVCSEIARDMNTALEITSQSSWSQFVEEFHRLFSLSSPSHPIFVLLDGLEELIGSSLFEALSYLSVSMPLNSFLLCTATPELRTTSPFLENLSWLKLPPLDHASGKLLLCQWLEEAGRRLTDAQLNKVLSAFDTSGNPAYLRATFNEVRHVPSTAALRPDPWPTTKRGVLWEGLFSRLTAADHGPEFTRRVLSYLAVSRAGLSENELLDICSMDPQIVQEVAARFPWSSTARRIPTVFWSRLYDDLEPYLGESYIDATTVIWLSDKDLREIVESRIVMKLGERALRFRIAHYFKTQRQSRRALDEMVWQAFKTDNWLYLVELITKSNIFELLYSRDICELINYWQAIEFNSTFRITTEYTSALIKQPITNKDFPSIVSNFIELYVRTTSEDLERVRLE